MTTPKDDREKLAAVMEALAEYTETASDREILEDAAAEGVDAKSEANRVRGVLMQAVLRAKKQRLHVAAQVHAQQVAALNSGASRLPSSASERRDLLQRTINQHPDTRQLVLITVQHREFDTLTDADVESALRQLVALGLLDEDTGGE